VIGETVGSYRITEQVSIGGMGTVYRAEHLLIGKPAAVKVLHPELRSNPEAVSRFFNEAKATTQIRHPGIVEIFDFGQMPSGDGYIIMEFLEGGSLASLLDEGTLDERRAASIMRGVCSALAAAHGMGVIHRDLKPDNVFVCPDPDAPSGERTKILDFGIAKLESVPLGGPNATKSGIVMGTPTYMSPEQCRGAGEIDLRADLYSIGCMLYEMVCGAPPFVCEGPGELIAMHLFVPPEPPSKRAPSLSPQAEQLILELLDKDPAKRPQTAAELNRRLKAIVNSGLDTPATGVQTTLEIPVLTPPLPTARTTATTMSGAASESLDVVEDARPSRKWLYAGAGAVALAILIAVMTAAGGGRDDESAPRAASPVESPVPASPAPVAAPPVALPPVAPPPVVVPAPPADIVTPVVVAKPKPTVPPRRPLATRSPPVAPHRPAKPDTSAKVPAPPPDQTGSAKILIEKDL